MLRPTVVLLILGLFVLLHGLNVARRQYSFQHYLRERQITANDFPAPYVTVLNDSVLHGEQPPLDFDYKSTFTKSKIPRTIHFIWYQNLYSTHNGGSQIPAAISRAPELCRQFNPDYDIKIWNATTGREFFATEYAWFLPTYDGYRYPIQRIDALKYFVLYHYGGVYMDLDIACRRPLDPLLAFPAWFPEASPLGVNNDLFAAAPGHPILKRMTQSLEAHNKNWIFPYLTIFYSTGPQFSSDILKEWYEHYKNNGLEVEGKGPDQATPSAFFILPQIYYSEQYTFFGHSPGGTWHGGDVAVVLWFVDHPWALLLVVAVLAAAAYTWRKRRQSLSRDRTLDKSNAV
ncbi:nucleotide-diphospho-sugar transferase [Ampelomyces quisqualis]|uniref:Nucleotide-diphospho-sugar transferase n=1 Tax=Ampelomyces quisqualis TaxID=50730 RepID=A0A6A5QE75_AMPQU|nr:nucleotide-diphospho-sugar transferase [Ampelomyces quisqualis]